VYQIDVTLQAAEQLARVVGLRRRIRRKLAGIGEATEQMLILQGGFFPGPPFLKTVVNGWLVRYELDLDQRRITVLAVEPRDGVRGPLQGRTA
jgi:hypothetical protein